MFFKFSDQLRVYNYEGQDFERLSLVVDKEWAGNNLSAVRKFFVSFFDRKSEDSRLVSLRNGLGELEAESCIAMFRDKEAVYFTAKGGATVWLVRGLKVVKLLDYKVGVEKVSGWLKEGDLYLWCLGGDLVMLERKLVEMAIGLTRMGSSERVRNWLESGAIDISNAGAFFVRSEMQNVVVESPESKFNVVHDEQNGLLVKWRKYLVVWRDWLTSRLEVLVQVVNKGGGVGGSWLQRLIDRLPTDEVIYAVETRKVNENLKSRNRRILLGVATVLLVSLSASIAWGVKQRRQAEWEQKFGEILAEARVKLQEGKQLAELNPTRARDLASQAGQLIKTLESRGLTAEDLQGLQNQLGNVLGVASGVKQAEVETWMGLGLIRQNMKAEDLAWFEDRIVVLDRDEDRVVEISIGDKSSKVIAGKEQVGEVQEIGVYGKALYVLSDKGIMELVDDQVKQVSDSDGEWGPVFDMKLYAGNIYLATSNEVWKYPVIESGFGSKQPWLEEGIESLIGGVSMDIDGFVWIAESDKVRKIAGGVEDNFQISDLDEPFSQIRDLYTDDKSVFIYLLEPSSNRIVVIEKDSGKYKKQYVADEFSQASDLVVREVDGVMLVLAGEVIYEVKL